VRFTVFGLTVIVARLEKQKPAEIRFPGTSVLSLPRLVGGQEGVQALFQRQRIPHDLVNTRLVVDARELRTISDSAAREIVRQALSRKAPRLLHIRTSDAVAAQLLSAAEAIGIAGPSFYIRAATLDQLPPRSEWVTE
jgi:hypothetical protein